MAEKDSSESVVFPKKTGKVTILIAEDHPLMRQSIRHVLEREPYFEVVGEAADGNEAVKMASVSEPDVVMDIGMPCLDGLQATREIKAAHPATSVLVLTIHSDEQLVLGILEAGASGYLTKGVFGEQVVQAVRGVLIGEMVLSPSIGQQILKQATRYPSKPVHVAHGEVLSTREIEILTLAARGMSNKDIAAELGITLRTVKGHLANIFAKLGVSSRTESILVGLRSGFLTLDAGQETAQDDIEKTG